MRLPRGSDDADVIRARLRALLDEGASRGWVPGDLPSTPPGSADEDTEPPAHPQHPEDPAEDPDDPGAPPPGVPGAGRHRAAGTAVRLDPGRPGARALWIAAVAAVLVLLALTWLDRPTAVPVGPVASAPASSTPEQTAASGSEGGEATATPGTVVVSVVGRVSRPGLVTLPEGARVADAVEAAGGLLPGADAAGVNLAALLADGQQVAVGVPGATPPSAQGSAPTAAAGGAVDVNSAGVAELDGLPGVGPVLAQRIVQHREQHGPFQALEDLQDVPGIGPAILDGLADAATV